MQTKPRSASLGDAGSRSGEVWSILNITHFFLDPKTSERIISRFQRQDPVHRWKIFRPLPDLLGPSAGPVLRPSPTSLLWMVYLALPGGAMCKTRPDSRRPTGPRDDRIPAGAVARGPQPAHCPTPSGVGCPASGPTCCWEALRVENSPTSPGPEPERPVPQAVAHCP